MKLYHIGKLWTGDDDHILIISKDETGVFINSQDELKDWVYALNNPWSGTSMSYNVYPNYREGGWIATKTVIVYDSIDAEILASGDTPQDAITNVDQLIIDLSNTYHKEDKDGK